MPTADNIPFHLPKLKVTFAPEDDTKFLGVEDLVPEYFDVQFCPFQPLEQDPIFAAISKKHILLVRISNTAEDTTNPCSIIRLIRDDDDDARNYTCTWTQDGDSGKPLLCVAGEDAKIKIYDVIEGRLVRVLIGHGGDINDLSTCPTNPLIIASASDDTTVRIWSLDPIHAEQPCVCVLGGEGHQWTLLTIAWHDTGRFLLSAGHDQTVNLWAIPDLPEDPVRHPVEIHYPHFSTCEVHSGLVDCVAFYGDWILSRACHEETIVLWRIEGFSSKDPVPSPETAPTTVDPAPLTRSAFRKPKPEAKATQELYTRILSFSAPGCGPQFFMRFKLHHVPDQNPVLAFCNAHGKIFFWDMARIADYCDYTAALDNASSNPRQSEEEEVKRPSWLAPIIHRSRGTAKDKAEPTVRERKAQERTTPTDAERIDALRNAYNKETLQSWDGKYNSGDPRAGLKAHKAETIGVSTFVGRQAAWSPNGEWCVIVGSINLVLVLQRWAPSKVGASH